METLIHNLQSQMGLSPCANSPLSNTHTHMLDEINADKETEELAVQPNTKALHVNRSPEHTHRLLRNRSEPVNNNMPHRNENLSEYQQGSWKHNIKAIFSI